MPDIQMFSVLAYFMGIGRFHTYMVNTGGSEYRIDLSVFKWFGVAMAFKNFNRRSIFWKPNVGLGVGNGASEQDLFGFCMMIA